MDNPCIGNPGTSCACHFGALRRFAAINSASWGAVLAACGVVLGNVIVWTVIVLMIGAASRFASFSATHLASIMLGIWLLSTVMVPVVGHTVVNNTVETPQGGDIVLTQREAVNSAWDKPVYDTWAPFVATHPQWADYTEYDPKRDSSFNWKWYYAFQQVGDQMAEALSRDYQRATRQKMNLQATSPFVSVTAYTTVTLRYR